jgi:hypothetical protein
MACSASVVLPELPARRSRRCGRAAGRRCRARCRATSEPVETTSISIGLALAEAHDRALAEGALDLAERGVAGRRPGPVRVRRGPSAFLLTPAWRCSAPSRPARRSREHGGRAPAGCRAAPRGYDRPQPLRALRGRAGLLLAADRRCGGRRQRRRHRPRGQAMDRYMEIYGVYKLMLLVDAQGASSPSTARTPRASRSTPRSSPRRASPGELVPQRDGEQVPRGAQRPHRHAGRAAAARSRGRPHHGDDGFTIPFAAAIRDSATRSSASG